MRQQISANPDVSSIKATPAGLILGLSLSLTATHRPSGLKLPLLVIIFLQQTQVIFKGPTLREEGTVLCKLQQLINAVPQIFVEVMNSSSANI